MTINTEVLPVRPIGRIVPVIPVFMVNGKKIPILEIELPPAFGADQAVDLQGLLSVPWSSGSSSYLPDDLSCSFVSHGFLWLGFSELYPLSDSQNSSPPSQSSAA